MKNIDILYFDYYNRIHLGEIFMKTIYFNNSPYRATLSVADIHWINISFTQLHDHDYWEFFLLTDGECTQHLNRKTFAMKAGDGILLRPSDAHYFTGKDKNTEHINLSIRDEFIKAYCDFLGNDVYEKLRTSPELFYTPNGHEYNRIIEFANTFLSMIYAQQNHELMQKVFTTYILELIVNRYLINLQAFPKWMYELIHEINSPQNLDAFPKDIASKFNYSYSYILRVFKHYTGKTLVEYMNQIKMAHACKLLLQTKYTTLDIANRLGFNSLSYFNQVFKKTYGLSPRQYIKSFDKHEK